MSLNIPEIKATIKHHKEQRANNVKYLEDAQRRIEKRDALIAKYEKLLDQAQNPAKVEPALKKAVVKKAAADRSIKQASKAEKPAKKAAPKAAKKEDTPAPAKTAKPKLMVKKTVEASSTPTSTQE